MELLDEQLRQIMPNAPRSVRLASLPIINTTMAVYEINNERRVAAWLATLAAESGELKYQQEIADGSAYEGRKDLGNIHPGDGKKFKGHGRIQITGRSNHGAYTQYLRGKGHLPFIDFTKEPKRLAEEPYATDSAGWFWAVLHDLNSLADKRNFLKTQITVNGLNKKTRLPNHWTERKAFYERALRVLPDDFLLEGAEPVVDETSADVDEAESLLSATEEAKGVTTSDKPASETEGTPPPAPAAEVKASQVSWYTKITSLSLPAGAMAMLGAIANFVKGLPPYVWVVLGGVAVVICVVAYLRERDSKQQAHERTKIVMGAAADPTKNNLRLV